MVVLFIYGKSEKVIWINLGDRNVAGGEKSFTGGKEASGSWPDACIIHSANIY